MKESFPASGKNFQITTREGNNLVIVIHDDGRRECYHVDREAEEESLSMITLDDEEARLVGGLIGGMNYKPKLLETIDVALDDLIIEWYQVKADYKCKGKTIGELKVRENSGASIIAVVENDKKTY